MDKPIIGITTGDLNGVGLELIIKIFSDNRMMDLCTPVLFGSNKALNYYRKGLIDYPINFFAVKKLDALNPKQLNVFSCWEEEVSITPGELNEVGGKYAIRSLEVATQCLIDGEIDALITAPIHKRNTQLPNFKYPGHTPFFKEKFNAKDVVMMLYYENMRVALATEHIPLNQVSQHLTTRGIIQKCQIIHESLIRDFGIDAPKIAILGLNPHAGDNGLLGNEEAEIIVPAIQALQEQGILAFGPYSADAYFGNSTFLQFDATLAMYHDQGLIPFKSMAGHIGVNYTCGLPKVRTSPDHGVAFDIAGKNIASEDSFRESIFQAISLIKQRATYDAQTANPIVKQTLTKE